MKTRALRIVVTLILGSAALVAQSFVANVSKRGTTAAPFLSLSQGARATAMGSAFVAVADDATALYWNPAGLAGLRGANVIFDHTEWIADVKYNFMGLTYNLGSLGTVGVSFTSTSIGEMAVTTIDEPNGTGETFGASDIAVSLAYAIRLTENFAIGFNPKFISQTIWKMNANAIAIDVGARYATPFKGITLGLSISNFGSKMRLSGNSTLVLHDLDPTSSGNNERVPAYLETEEWDLPLNFRVGVAYTPSISDKHRVVVAVDASHPNDNYESVNVGAEYTFDDLISIRGGYKSLFLQDSEESLTVGAGVKQHLLGNLNITVDYAYSDLGRLKSSQKLTVGVRF